MKKSILFPLLLTVLCTNGSKLSAAGESELSDVAIPYQKLPDRPRPLLELGDPFLDTGNLHPGFELPTGAVWQPKFLAFGTLRSALQTVDTGASGNSKRSEWVNRLDLFGQLRLTGTERFIIGFRPLDKDGNFSGHQFDPTDNSVDALNFNIETLFFEGEFTELFPNLDLNDSKRLDYGLSIGRQPLLFQDGILMNDTIDSIGIVRNNLLPFSATNSRATLLFGWDEVNRDNNVKDRSANLFGLFTETDFACNTVNLDLVFVEADDSTGDAFFWGLSSIQRMGHFNTSFRALGSHPTGTETAATSEGYLLFGEVSWTPPYTHNIAYVNAFWGIDEFSSAARGPSTGGPLGRAGILFAATGLGDFGPALGNRADESVGGSVGYQMFFDDTRRQLILEVGGRTDTDTPDESAGAVGARIQQAIGRRWIVQADVFGATQETQDESWGARIEILMKY